MSREQEQPFKFRGVLVVFAVAFIATAGLLAFSGEDPTVDQTAAAANDARGDRNEAVGVVRARGGGLSTPEPRAQTPAPTVRLFAVREQAEEEVRDRIGDEETDSPEGANAVDDVVDLIESGTSLQEAVNEVLGSREDPSPSPALPLPLP